MLYVDETLEEEDVLMILFMNKKYKTALWKSRSRKDGFFSKFRCRRAADNEFPAFFSLSRVRTMIKQTISYSSSFLFSDLTLSIE